MVGDYFDELRGYFHVYVMIAGAPFASNSPTVLLPHTNLPLMLPLLQNEHPHNFSVKDQHLLKPPPAMGAAGGFGRRASDGGANLPIFFQKHLEHSDWTMQQQQQQEELQERLQERHQVDQWHRLPPLHLNGHSAPSHSTAPGIPSLEGSEEPPNSHDLARYLLTDVMSTCLWF